MIDEQSAIAILGPEQLDGAEVAAEVGSALARAGYVVIVSGGGAAANAAARGALDRRGKVLAALEPGQELTPGRGQEGLLTRVEHASVFRRIEAVLERADALVVLPGDLGALAALLQVWAYGHTRSGPYRPLILLGDRWSGIVAALADAAALDRRTRAMVTFASTPEEAVETLRYYVAPGG